MREIKFRAWDSRTNEMTDDVSVHSNEWVSCWFNSGHEEKYTPQDNHIHLMQYTGLKDGNGKEIYEGDIDGSDEPMYVAFEDGSFGLKFKDKPHYFDNCINWDMCEIIGNIYETPELLQQPTG